MSGKENIAKSVCDFLLSEGLLADRDLSKLIGVQSPIEELFVLGVRMCQQVEATWLEQVMAAETLSYSKFKLEPQKQIEGYRVDFLLTVMCLNGKARSLVIECDGHNFHERTKEQAISDKSRDRRMQELGHTVFRFTGSELYRDAFSCARQVMKWAEDRVTELEP